MNYLTNTFAFFLPALLLGFWTLLGYSALSISRTQRHTLQNLLLSPIVGFSITLLFVFWLNRLGISVSHFARILLLALFLISLGILFYRKPLFPFKQYLPFAGIFIFALFLIAKPLWQYGFDWVSFANDDMANYALGAERFLNYGYFDIPNVDDFVARKDFSLIFWFWHVPGTIRSGSELALAWVSGVFHLNPLQIFMPLIVSFYLMLLSVTGAMVYASSRYYFPALVTLLLLSFSPLNALGTLYQMITQVVGLSVFIAVLILLCQPFSLHQKYNVIKQSVLIGIIFSALIETYAELIPFLALSCMIYYAVTLVKGWRPNKSFWLTGLLSIVFVILFLNTHLIATFEFIRREFQVLAESVVQVGLFPYFLIPSGLANILGFMPIAQNSPEPYLSLSIISAGLLLLVLFVAALSMVLRRTFLPAIVFVVMSLVGLQLFFHQYGFGLYKLSMYIQPFLLAVLTLLIFNVIKKSYLKIAIILIFVYSTWGSYQFYLVNSIGKTPVPFNETAYASPTKLNTEYRHLISAVPANSLLLTDEFNISVIKFQALQSRNHSFIPLTSPNNFTVNVLPDHYYVFPKIHNTWFYGNQGRPISTAYAKNNFSLIKFNLHSPQNKIEFTENKLSVYDLNRWRDAYFIADTPLRSIFNRWNALPESKSHNFTLHKVKDLNNHLVFIDSSLGRVYHSVIANNMGQLSLFNLEKDYFYPDNSMQSLGRYLLMKVINPNARVRMEINISNSFNGDGKNVLPPAAIVGTQRVKFPIVGRGSARVFSEPFTPQKIQGKYYVVTDMNTNGIVFPAKRNGIMSWFNKNITLDYRHLATYARDISLVSDADYQRMQAPTCVQNFPADLANKNLEYSGIYEDGWISENAFVTLATPHVKNTLKISGLLPQIQSNFTSSELRIKVDGKKLFEKKLKPGDFNIELPLLSRAEAKHKIELYFNTGQQLPKGDDRPIGAQIKFIGFE